MKPMTKTALYLEAKAIRQLWLARYGYANANKLSLAIRRQFLAAKKGVRK